MGRVVIAITRVVVRRKVKVSEEGGFRSYPLPFPFTPVKLGTTA